MPGFDAYLTSLEARIAALEEIALEAESLRDEVRQTECLHSPPSDERPNVLGPTLGPGGETICGDCGLGFGWIGLDEAGALVLDQVQQLAANPYLPEEIEGGTP